MVHPLSPFADILVLVAYILQAFKSKKIRPNPILKETARRIDISQGRAPEAQPQAQAQAHGQSTATDQPPAARQENRQLQGGTETRRTGGGDREDAHKAADAAVQHAEQERRKAEEHGRKAEEAAEKDRLDRMEAVQEMLRMSTEQREVELERQSAENAAAEARAARDMAEMKLREGIRPMRMPTLDEMVAAKKKLKYKEELFHFAVAGAAGTGKSSLVNALRGLRNKKRGAAPTGTSETTMETTRYPDSNSSNPFVWYDVPGAGTQNTPDWVYFVEQGLYIFDSIIVVYGDRFTEIDIAILKNCDRWQIPAYVVRSKAGLHIQNVMNDLVGSESDDEDEDVPTGFFDRFRGPAMSERWVEARDRARGQYIKDTRKDVHDNLEQAGLPQQRVYIVDKDILVPVVNGKTHPDTIDEAELYSDLLAEASRRRIVAD